MNLYREESPIRLAIRIVNDHQYHWHTDLTIVKVIAGTIKVRVWAKDNYMSKGDIIIFNIGELHRLSAITKENLVLITHISEAFCKRAYPEFEDLIILCNSVRYLNIKPSIYANLENRLNNLINEIRKPYDQSPRIDAIGEDLIIYLCQNFDFIACGQGLKRFSDKIINRNRFLYREVFKNNSELNGASLKEISRYLGISYSYLRSDIIERYGFGFNWLKYTVMTETAAKLILTTDLNLLTIGMHCGFSDPKYLIKYMKIFYECTPSEFRRRYKGIDLHSRDNYIEIPIEHMMDFYELLK